MKNYIKELRSKFKKYEIDCYVIPKNDDYFTEYSKLNRLEVISNFSGSAGLAIILKNKNYLFTDGRYTIQSKIESGKHFKIYGFEKLKNCSLFKNLTLGIDPKLFTNTQIKNYFLKHNKIKYIKKNLIDEIKKQKEDTSIPFFSLDKVSFKPRTNWRASSNGKKLRSFIATVSVPRKSPKLIQPLFLYVLSGLPGISEGRASDFEKSRHSL